MNVETNPKIFSLDKILSVIIFLIFFNCFPECFLVMHFKPMNRRDSNDLLVGLVSISDRAFQGKYIDHGLPALNSWLSKALLSPWQSQEFLIPDDYETIIHCLKNLVDYCGCDLIFTTGGTGPARRDVTPEATLSVGTKQMMGFSEKMRQISLLYTPTAILSRQVAVIRENSNHAALIINLPGQPRAITEILGGSKRSNDKGSSSPDGIFSAIPYCIDLLDGPFIETNSRIVQCFRPK